MPATSTPLIVAPSEDSDPKLSETADLLEALRKKRNARESVEDLEPHPPTEGLRVVELDPDDMFENSIDETSSEPALEVVPDPTPEPAPAPVSAEPPSSPKRGRASIPSWDEIVFGTKTED
jgi:hypothetical protein